jgi:thioredoxin 1
MFSYVKNIARHTLKSDVLEAKDGKLDVVDFAATWCGPCKAMEPTLEKLAQRYEYKVDFFRMDVDDEPEMAQMFGIRSVPTVIFFKNGKKVDLFVGAMSEQKLETEIKKYV